MIYICRRGWILKEGNVVFNKKYQHCIIVIVLKNCINEFVLTSHHLTYTNRHVVTCPQTQHPKPITQICMCGAKGVFKLPNQHAEFLIIDSIVKIQKKSWGYQVRGWGEDHDSIKVTDVLEYIEDGMLRCKGEERSLSQQISVLDFCNTIRDSLNATWIVEHWA